MRTRFTSTLVLAILMGGSMAFGHGWSEQMSRELDSPVPDWLSIGAAIKVDPAGEISDDQTAFRSISGDSRSTRSRVILPDRGLEIKVDYPISWYRGSSLSPDGTMLIINSGTESKVYEILPDGSHRAVELTLPRVTYDAEPKGFIAGWSWADGKTLIGESEVDNEKGEFIEKRIYVFDKEKSILRRLDVSSLNLPTTEGLTVSKVGLGLDRLRISVGNSEFTVKADLTSPRGGERQETDAPKATEPLVAPKPQTPKSPEAKSANGSEEPMSSTRWPVVAIVFVAVLGLLLLLLKRRATGAVPNKRH